MGARLPPEVVPDGMMDDAGVSSDADSFDEQDFNAGCDFKANLNALG